MSKILIAYAGKHGCTEECARTLAGKLTAGADLCNLKEKQKVDLDAYDKIILGGSIYAGRIQKEVKDLCAKNENLLKGKKLGLYICGMSEGDTAKKQLEASFPQGLLDSALAKESFGGKLEISKMNFMEKKIIKMIAKTEADMSNVSESMIDQFAQAMNKA